MISEKLTFFDKIQLYLFNDENDPPAELIFNNKELRIRTRYQNVFVYWIDKPNLSDKKILQFMVSSLGISKRQAYRDIIIIKILLNDVRSATKKWQRYKVIYMLDEAYELAEMNHDEMGMIKAADLLGKYTNLDKEDAPGIPYDEIVPQPFEPTDDVSVLGIKPIENLKERQEQLRKEYDSDLLEVIGY